MKAQQMQLQTLQLALALHQQCPENRALKLLVEQQLQAVSELTARNRAQQYSRTLSALGSWGSQSLPQSWSGTSGSGGRASVPDSVEASDSRSESSAGAAELSTMSLDCNRAEQAIELD